MRPNAVASAHPLPALPFLFESLAIGLLGGVVGALMTLPLHGAELAHRQPHGVGEGRRLLTARL